MPHSVDVIDEHIEAITAVASSDDQHATGKHKIQH